MTFPIIFQDNRFADATPVASSTAVGAPGNIADLRSYTFFGPNVLPATLTVDCGVAKAVDSLAVRGHDLGSKGCTIELRGSTDNFVASNNLVATHTPTSDKPFALTFASVSYRYWQIKITGAGAAPIIAMIIAGAALYMPNGVQAGFDPFRRKLNSQSSNNENGQPLGKIIAGSARQETMRFNVTKAWLRSTFEPAWDAGLQGNPALIAWDLAGYPDEIFYIVFGDQPAAPHGMGPIVVLSIEIKGPV